MTSEGSDNDSRMPPDSRSCGCPTELPLKQLSVEMLNAECEQFFQ